MADFDSLSYFQRRNLDNFPAKYHVTLEFFFKIDILLQIFWAKSIPRKTAHPWIPLDWAHLPKRLARGLYFNNVKFTRNVRSYSKSRIEKQDGKFVAMETKDLQTLNLKFDQVMFNSLVLTWERNFEVTFSIFSVLVFQISVLESYLDIYLC